MGDLDWLPASLFMSFFISFFILVYFFVLCSFLKKSISLLFFCFNFFVSISLFLCLLFTFLFPSTGRVLVCFPAPFFF